MVCWFWAARSAAGLGGFLDIVGKAKLRRLESVRWWYWESGRRRGWMVICVPSKGFPTVLCGGGFWQGSFGIP